MTVQIPSSLPLSREIALPPGSQVITLPSSGHYSLSFRQSENGTQLVVVPVDRDTETAPPMTVGAATEVPHMKRFLRQKLLEKKAREQLAKKEQRMRLKEARQQLQQQRKQEREVAKSQQKKMKEQRSPCLHTTIPEESEPKVTETSELESCHRNLPRCAPHHENKQRIRHKK